jgi:small conductance mechanosensitive channel
MASPINTNTNVSGGSEGGSIDFANLWPYILTKFVQAAEAVLIIIIGLFIIRYAKRYLNRIALEHEQQKTALNLFEKLLTGFIIVISITLALRVVGIDMTLLVSVTILGLSYGLQDIIKNYVAGILIMFKSPFKIGDIINIKGQTGKVDKIDFQSTTLRTFDQKDVTIYNSDVMTQSIINHSHSNIRRIELEVKLGFGSDFLHAIKVFDQIVRNSPNLLKKPSHKIIFKKFDDNGLIFTIRAWTQLPCNILAVKSDLALQVSQIYDESIVFLPHNKDIQLETDYTLSDANKARQDTLRKSSNLTVDDSQPIPADAELIDFEEID